MDIPNRAGAAMVRLGLGRVLRLGSTGLFASQIAVHAMPAEARWWSSGSQPEKKRPVVVCGPSGVGKGTLLSRLMAEYPNDFGFSVSHTTRKPRAGEENGVHYHFVDKPDMEAAIERGEFIEYARVHSNIYGTSIKGVEAVRAAGKTCLLDIDVQGAELVKKTDLNAIFIFVAPPSYEELERRLRGRGTETEDKIQTRLKNAHTEMGYMDKPGFFDCIIVNDDLDTAYGKLKAVCVPAK